MSMWNHAICRPCWDARDPYRTPARLKNPEPRICCYCGRSTVDGILVRDDPAWLRCGGEHGDKDDE